MPDADFEPEDHKNDNQGIPTSENIENKYSNIYGFKSSDERRYRNYLKNPYYKGEDIDFHKAKIRSISSK